MKIREVSIVIVMIICNHRSGATVTCSTQVPDTYKFPDLNNENGQRTASLSFFKVQVMV